MQLATPVLDIFSVFGRFAMFTGQVIIRIFSRPIFTQATLNHLAITCQRCVGPVIAVNLPFGSVLSLQGLQIFEMFGAQRLLSSLVSVAILREIAPVMASVIVAAQGGSSCAAELGAMRIKEELDATEIMAVDSLRLHVVPRVVALTIACPLLYIVGALAALIGSYLTAIFVEGEASGVFLYNLWTLTEHRDLWAGILKTSVFGGVIGLIASYQGFRATGGAAGVGRAVNETVVYSVLVFITLNYFLTSALYGAP